MAGPTKIAQKLVDTFFSVDFDKKTVGNIAYDKRYYAIAKVSFGIILVVLGAVSWRLVIQPTLKETEVEKKLNEIRLNLADKDRQIAELKTSKASGMDPKFVERQKKLDEADRAGFKNFDMWTVKYSTDGGATVKESKVGEIRTKLEAGASSNPGVLLMKFRVSEVDGKTFDDDVLVSEFLSVTYWRTVARRMVE